MALLIWNVQGLGSGVRKNELLSLVKERKVDIFGIIETKIQKDDFVAATLGLED